MDSPKALASLTPPRRASQVPRRICSRAPSTSTPESPTTASTHASSPVSGFIPKGRTGHSQFYPFTRPNRFAFAMAHEFAFPGFASRIAPTHAGSATCTMGNLHGQHLAADKIRQAFLAHPLTKGAAAQRRRSRSNSSHCAARGLSCDPEGEGKMPPAHELGCAETELF